MQHRRGELRIFPKKNNTYHLTDITWDGTLIGERVLAPSQSTRCLNVSVWRDRSIDGQCRHPGRSREGRGDEMLLFFVCRRHGPTKPPKNCAPSSGSQHIETLERKELLIRTQLHLKPRPGRVQDVLDFYAIRGILTRSLAQPGCMAAEIRVGTPGSGLCCRQCRLGVRSGLPSVAKEPGPGPRCRGTQPSCWTIRTVCSAKPSCRQYMTSGLPVPVQNPQGH